MITIIRAVTLNIDACVNFIFLELLMAPKFVIGRVIMLRIVISWMCVSALYSG